MKSRIREIIREEIQKLNEGKSPKINDADNAVFSALIKLRKAIESDAPNAKDEFYKIKNKFNDELSKFYKKHNI